MMGLALNILFIVLAAFAGAFIYRLRGGPIKDDLGVGTQTARLIWVLPTAALVGLVFQLMPIQVLYAALALFLGLVLIGHGAHMIINAKLIRKHFDEEGWMGNTTELVTFWLPAVYGGSPNPGWSNADLVEYNILGMTLVGIARHAISYGPLIYLGHGNAWWMIAAGFTHGLAYWAGGTSQRGEEIVGATTWAALAAIGVFAQ